MSARAFRDRSQAGAALARALDGRAWLGRAGPVVLALPRGGVPVAYEVATRLGAPLDVFLVRKLGVPGREELGMGAVASGGVRVLNSEVIERASVSPEVLERVTATERAELERRQRAYRPSSSPPALSGRVAILVDDGVATGATMRAAVAAARQLAPARCVVAVPAAPADTCALLAAEADEVV
ncbi:MAG: phosphoribosyltransferase, partial [Acidimicrobiales bacterium]